MLLTLQLQLPKLAVEPLLIVLGGDTAAGAGEEEPNERVPLVALPQFKHWAHQRTSY